ncbi:MAG: hypothetical protein SPG55_04255, partial [Prevotella sp.]|nr:hypothetical protein [Prevotellaceae bacterium]MDY5343405.1 hypothetical protein [Prevotella sp.]
LNSSTLKVGDWGISKEMFNAAIILPFSHVSAAKLQIKIERTKKKGEKYVIWRYNLIYKINIVAIIFCRFN